MIRNKRSKYFVLIASLVCTVVLSAICGHAQNKTLAFPGADGFGKYTSGGRGGKVLIVSNLNDSGPGSLREAVAQNFPRIIVFSVAGTIALESTLSIKHGNVTIAGQSAPGGGVCLKNYSFQIEADNVIIRFLRFRLGDEQKQEADAIGANNGSRSVIIDHCSMSWATDECASFYRNSEFTLQWSIISESLNSSVHQKGEHGYGGIWGGEGASFHHNIISSHSSRMPRFSGSSTTPNSKDELVDFVNNVIYNWRNNNVYGGESGRYNIVNNFYKTGPATRKAKAQILNPWEPFGQFYVNGNILHGSKSVNEDNSLGVVADKSNKSMLVKDAFASEIITIQNAREACDVVLARAGASLDRDEIDRRIVHEVRTGTASKGKKKDGIIDSQVEAGGWPALSKGNAPVDEDGDGMPDEWERKNKLDPIDATDANKRTLHPEYDNVEVYLNGIVSHIVTGKS